MTERKYPPLQSRLGRVARPPETKEIGGKPAVTFTLAVNQSYDRDDVPQWVTVTAFGERARASALQLAKGDRVSVEGNFKETQGRDRTFYDLSAMAIWRAVPVEQDDEL